MFRSRISGRRWDPAGSSLISGTIQLWITAYWTGDETLRSRDELKEKCHQEYRMERYILLMALGLWLPDYSRMKKTYLL